jgi:hypothetical protein
LERGDNRASAEGTSETPRPDLLADFATDDGKVSASVRNLGDMGMAGHFVLDAKEQLSFMDIEENAIYRRESGGRVALLVVDPRLMWPDTMASDHITTFMS